MQPGEKHRKIFVLGVGAQKAGTTWLHRQLCTSPVFDPGFAKEYHTFDALFSPVCGSIRQRLLLASQRALQPDSSEQHSSSAPPNSQHTKRLSFLERPDNYFEYFDYLWLSQAHIEATGDITPSYSTLDADAFQLIRTGLLAKGFSPKVIFLMRDPIERIWSMLRMEWRNRGLNLGFEDEMKQLKTRHQHDGMQLRTRYDRTLTTLEKIFQPEELFYGFYEDLFSSTGFTPIQQFLGIPIPAPDFATSINASPKQENTLPRADVAAAVAQTYRSVYQDVQARFGDRATQLWPGYQFLT